MKLSKEYEQRLADMYGRLPNGKPKLRIVTPEEAVRPHGKWAGSAKYFHPETGKRLECLMVEMWIPPTMMGSRESWPHELMGPFPADCDGDCCDRGYWSLKFPISVDGEFVPLDEGTMQSIERKQFFDVQWSLMSEIERQQALDANLSEREQKSDARSLDEYIELADHFAINKEKEDNADNRIFVFPESIQPQAKGIREAIGRPNI